MFDAEENFDDLLLQQDVAPPSFLNTVLVGLLGSKVTAEIEFEGQPCQLATDFPNLTVLYSFFRGT